MLSRTPLRTYKLLSLSPRLPSQAPPRVRTIATCRTIHPSRKPFKPAVHSPRSFSTSPTSDKGLIPDSENPEPPKTQPVAGGSSHVAEPTDISEDEFHEIADEYIEQLVVELEMMQEDREDVEVEYSAGVLSLIYPPAGTYVLNKQPPNKQIWLSSPVSGPKRYDWVIQGDSMHHKEGTTLGGSGGRWVYLRDGSTLNDLLKREVGIELGEEVDGYE